MKKTKGQNGKTNKRLSPSEKQEAREMMAFHYWRLHTINGWSFPKIAEEEKTSLGNAYNLVQEGSRVVARWRDTENMESDRNTAIARLEYIFATSKPFYERGNAKHGALMLKAVDVMARIQGLMEVNINLKTKISGDQVLDRVKQASGVMANLRIVSPLVAQILPKLTNKEPAQ